MPIVMMMTWPGMTTAQYDEVRKAVNWEADPPAGGMFHVASHDGSAIRITDVWDSAESFQRFVDERLMPGVERVGIKGEPQVEVLPTHAIFTPGYKPK